MSKKSGTIARKSRPENSALTQDRTKRRTYAITQRGVKTSKDLSDFHSAALADIDAGRADLKEMTLMRALTGQIIAHENMKLKAFGGLTEKAGKFLTGK